MIGQTYCGEFWTSWAADNSDRITQGLGIAFWESALDTSVNTILTSNPQVYSSDFIEDSTIWVKVSQTFIADKAYTHLIVGHFGPENTPSAFIFKKFFGTTPGCLNRGAYYFIDDVSVVPYVSPNLSIQLSTDTACANMPFTLTASGAGSYQWARLDQPDSILATTDSWTFFPEAGASYILTGITCDLMTKDTFSFPVHPDLGAGFGADTTICENQPLLLDAGPNGLSYLWSDSSVMRTFNVSTPGIYWTEVTDSKGCITRDSISVSIGDLNITDLGPDTSLCSGTFVDINLSSEYLQPSWSNSIPGYQNTVVSPGTYWVTALDSNGCTVTDTVVLGNADPTPSIGGNRPLCVGDSLLLSPVLDYLQYMWDDGSTSKSRWVYAPGTYFVEVLAENACTGRDAVLITVGEDSLDLGPDRFLCEGDTLTLSLVGTWLDYEWSGGIITSSLSVTETGQYQLKAINDNLCLSTDELMVLPQTNCPGTLEMPNMFSPNVDGINDVFRPVKAYSISRYDLQIYDRWGRKVFETQLVDTAWAGQAFGEAAPGGVYYWIVKYTDDEGQEFVQKGNLLLAR
ncbi:MAG: gliding motility-associated C-terminal domain-containing protein [Bacteroidota bacterium]